MKIRGDFEVFKISSAIVKTVTFQQLNRARNSNISTPPNAPEIIVVKQKKLSMHQQNSCPGRFKSHSTFSI